MINVVICGVGGRVGRRIGELLIDPSHLYYPHIKFIAGLEGSTEGLSSVTTYFKKMGPYEPYFSCSLEELMKLKTESPDVGIDFTVPAATLKNLPLFIENEKPLVIGTTGFTSEQKKEIEKASEKIPICLSSNMSVGVNILFKLISEAVQLLGDDYDAEVIEAHHSKKKDAPSGTAKSIGEVLLKAYEKIGLKKHLRYERNGADCLRDHEEIGMQTIRGGDIVGDHTVIFAGLGERLEIKHQATNRDLFAKGAIRAAKWLVENKKNKPGLYDMQDVLGLK